LTVLLHSKYVSAQQKSRIFCFNGQRRALTAREKCKTIFSKNITIDHLGKITIVLSDYLSFPDNFQKLFNDGDTELKYIFQVSFLHKSSHSLIYTIEMTSFSASEHQGINRRKKIGERTVKELIGSSPEDFLDHNRYKTTVKKS